MEPRLSPLSRARKFYGSVKDLITLAQGEVITLKTCIGPTILSSGPNGVRVAYETISSLSGILGEIEVAADDYEKGEPTIARRISTR